VSTRARRGSRGGRRPATAAGGHPFLWGILAGVVLVVTAGYFLLPPPPPPGITPAAPSRPSAPAVPAASGRAQPASAPAPEFDFYTILRDMEVKVPDWQIEAEKTLEQQPEAAIPAGVYVLQVGAFRRSEDAERARADLALKGIRAAIQEVTINGTERWFRVRVGPFAEIEALRQARATLIEQGVGFIVVKDRKG
jgi:cell division protein FtsN